MSIRAALAFPADAARSFHPHSMPLLARAHYRREMSAWLALSVMMGAIEGGVTSSLAQQAFKGAVDDRTMSLAVGILAGAPAFANLSSLVWSSFANGRAKVRFITGLQLLTVLAVGQFMFAPRTAVGLLMLIGAGVGGRVLWSGVITLRSTIWRQNFQRASRAHVAGKIATAQSAMLALTGYVIGLAQEHWTIDAYRALYPVAAGVGLLGAALYRRTRVRRHAALLRDERAHVERTKRHPLASTARVLIEDRPFRRYMTAMFAFGFGNLAILAPLLLMVEAEPFAFSVSDRVLLTSTIPIATMPLIIPLWSRLLDTSHIVRFRVYHSWVFIATTTCILLGAFTGQAWLLWLGAFSKGASIAGGVLGWNLGHHDFAPPERASEYMAVHVTLTGIRGLIAPLAGVAAYEWLTHDGRELGPLVFVGCLVLNLIGAASFYRIWRSMKRDGIAHMPADLVTTESQPNADEDPAEDPGRRS